MTAPPLATDVRLYEIFNRSVVLIEEHLGNGGVKLIKPSGDRHWLYR